jgi:hypothetical protein
MSQYDKLNLVVEDILDCFEDENDPLAKEILDRMMSLQMSMERKEQERQAKISQVKAQITDKLKSVQGVINAPNVVENMISQRTAEPLERIHTAIGEAITVMKEVC